MNLIRKLYVKADSFARGQTMAEYVLVVAAIAVVVYAGYQTTGTTVSALVTTVDTQL
jgi:Flp pilus assembly pilin Flp